MSDNSNIDETRYCSITNGTTSNNQLGKAVSSIVALPLGTDNTAGGQGLSGNFKVLTLKDGSQEVAANSRAEVYLYETFIDSEDLEEVSSIYDLNLFASSDLWFYPLSNQSVFYNLFGDPAGFEAVSLSDNDVNAMRQTDNFLQLYSANPNAKICTEYTNALNSAQEATNSAAGSSGDTTVQSVDDAVSAVFSGYPAYNLVNMDSIILMQAYYNVLPYIWAGYNDEYYFYFHNSASQFVGRLDLIKGSTIDTNAKNGGYTITFYPASNPKDTESWEVNEGSGIDVVYSGGMFYDDAGTIFTAIGGYIYKNIITGKSSDISLIPILSGNYEGQSLVSVVSSTDKKSSPSDNAWTDFNDFISNNQVFTKFLQLAGIGLTIFFVGDLLLKAIGGIYKKCKSKGEDEVTEEDVKQTNEEVANNMEDTTGKLDDLIEKNKTNLDDTGVNSEDMLDSNIEEMSKKSGETSSSMDNSGLKNQSMKASEITAKNLEEVTIYESNMNNEQLKNVNELANDLQKTEQEINNTDVTDSNARGSLTSNLNDTKEINTNISDMSSEMSDTISTETAESIKINTTNIEEISNEQEKINEESESVESGDTDPKFEGNDPIID